MGVMVAMLSQASGSAVLKFDVVIPDLPLPAPQLVAPVLPLRPPPATYAVCFVPDMFAVCGGVIDLPEDPAPASGLIDFFGSVAHLRVVLSADTIEVIELRAKPRSVAVPLSEIDAAVLRTSLACDSSYDWNDDYARDFRPEFRVKFKHGPQTVTMDLCLSSRTARCVDTGDSITPTSLEFGYSTVATVIERYFPGATDQDR
jgi:hypothetical protein